MPDSRNKRQEPAYDTRWGMGIEKPWYDHRFGLKNPADAYQNLIYNEYNEIAFFMGLGCIFNCGHKDVLKETSPALDRGIEGVRYIRRFVRVNNLGSFRKKWVSHFHFSPRKTL